MKILGICGILVCTYFGWLAIERGQWIMLPAVLVGILLWANLLDLPRRQKNRWAKQDERIGL